MFLLERSRLMPVLLLLATSQIVLELERERTPQLLADRCRTWLCAKAAEAAVSEAAGRKYESYLDILVINIWLVISKSLHACL